MLDGYRAALGSARRAGATSLLARAAHTGCGTARSRGILRRGGAAKRPVSATTEGVIATCAAFANAGAACAGAVSAAPTAHDPPHPSPPQTRPVQLGVHRFFRRRRRWRRWFRLAAFPSSPVGSSTDAAHKPAASRARNPRRESLTTAAFSASAMRLASTMTAPDVSAGVRQALAKEAWEERGRTTPRPCDGQFRRHRLLLRPRG